MNLEEKVKKEGVRYQKIMKIKINLVFIKRVLEHFNR